MSREGANRGAPFFLWPGNLEAEDFLGAYYQT
jgi:hypothetical protein